ncbi:MAG: hypothetical protein JWM99_1590 [Verrucomicrobiales bacterium]|nr:hypothetical protein [Verrucomicrobiales bacterium]
MEITRPESRIFNRAAKSGRLRGRRRFTGGGGERSATTFPRLLISTCSPPSIQSRTVLKSCRTWRIDAVFMLHNHVSPQNGGQSRNIPGAFHSCSLALRTICSDSVSNRIPTPEIHVATRSSTVNRSNLGWLFLLRCWHTFNRVWMPGYD